MNVRIPLLLVLFAGGAVVAANAQTPPPPPPQPALDWRAELLSRVPPYVNVLSVVQLEKMLNTPRGLREGWAEKYENGYLNGAVPIPPTVQTSLVATELDWRDPSDSRIVTLVLLRQPAKMSLPQFVARERGLTDTFDGKAVALTSRHGYVVPFNSRVFGSMSPADRPVMAKWLRTALAVPERPALGSFLTETYAARDLPQITIALETQDVFAEGDLLRWLQASLAFRGKTDVDLGALAKVLARLRGVQFYANVTEATQARLRFEFLANPEAYAENLRTVLVEWIEQWGAGVPELRTAKMVVDPYGISLDMELSDDSLRRILSLAFAPTALVDQPTYEMGPDADASVRYYQQVVGAVSGLERLLNNRAEDYAKTALWHESYARRIEQLDTAGVDQAVVEYGSKVANMLRALASSLRGEGLDLSLLEGQARWQLIPIPYVTVRYGAYGYYPGSAYQVDNFSQVRAAQAAKIKAGADERMKIWDYLSAETEAVRKAMLEKYKIDFGSFKKPG